MKVVLSALALAMAAVIKPQIAVVFMAVDLFTGRAHVAARAVAIAGALFVIALAIHGDASAITQSWLGNMRALMHAEADPLHGSLPHQLINLQSPLAVLTGSRPLSTMLAIATCGLMGLMYVWIDRRSLSAADSRAAAQHIGRRFDTHAVGLLPSHIRCGFLDDPRDARRSADCGG
jgi:hypothetical protein